MLAMQSVPRISITPCGLSAGDCSSPLLLVQPSHIPPLPRRHRNIWATSVRHAITSQKQGLTLHVA